MIVLFVLDIGFGVFTWSDKPGEIPTVCENCREHYAQQPRHDQRTGVLQLDACGEDCHKRKLRHSGKLSHSDLTWF